jgi:hypothetical protein
MQSVRYVPTFQKKPAARLYLPCLTKYNFEAETAGLSESLTAIKLDRLTSQKTIDRDSLKYPTESVIFNL